MTRNATARRFYIASGLMGALVGVTFIAFFLFLGIALLAYGLDMESVGRFWMTPDKALVYFGLAIIESILAGILAGIGSAFEP